MESIDNKTPIIEKVRLLEGSNFECNEEAIIKEYESRIGNTSSLPIKVLSIVGGIMATLAILGFLFLADVYDSKLALFIVGIGFIVTAIYLNKAYDKLITDTFSISLYVAGFTLFGLALSGSLDLNEVLLILIVIAFGSLFITQNYMISFVSLVIISGSLLFLIVFNTLFHLAHIYTTVAVISLTYIFLNEAKIISIGKKMAKLYEPLRIQLILSLLAGLFLLDKRFYYEYGFQSMSNPVLTWILPIVMLAVLLYLVHHIIKITQITSTVHQAMIYALSALFVILTINSPAISAAIIIVLLSFLVNYKTGLVLGITTFIYFVSVFYYDLSFTLLTKSLILFFSGLIFLTLYLLTAKMIETDEKV